MFTRKFLVANITRKSGVSLACYEEVMRKLKPWNFAMIWRTSCKKFGELQSSNLGDHVAYLCMCEKKRKKIWHIPPNISECTGHIFTKFQGR